jgi:hypothetical protein
VEAVFLFGWFSNLLNFFLLVVLIHFKLPMGSVTATYTPTLVLVMQLKNRQFHLSGQYFQFHR